MLGNLYLNMVLMFCPAEMRWSSETTAVGELGERDVVFESSERVFDLPRLYAVLCVTGFHSDFAAYLLTCRVVHDGQVLRSTGAQYDALHQDEASSA